MNWVFSISRKRKAAIILGIVFLVVLVKNRMDYYDVHKLAKSFATVYEDRLVVESYIYKLSELLYQKKQMLDNCAVSDNITDLKTQVSSYDADISMLMSQYKLTKLTEKEDEVFQDLEVNIGSIAALQSQYLSQLEIDAVSPVILLSLNDQFLSVAGKLEQLSDIQLAEGRMLNEQSQKIVAGNEVLTQFELALLIGLGLIIQVLIFTSRTLSIPKFKNANLN
ncbi:MAG: MCP four helix bundle domain-containing protein [Saprospiraceae bacterium]|nr:MCP four helix bundle domain-containing protein [Saprospiraceae bacterium]